MNYLYANDLIRSIVTNANPKVTPFGEGTKVTYTDNQNRFIVTLSPWMRQIITLDHEEPSIYTALYNNDTLKVGFTVNRNGIDYVLTQSDFDDEVSKYGISFVPRTYDVIINESSLGPLVLAYLSNPTEKFDHKIKNTTMIVYSINTNDVHVTYKGVTYEIEPLIRTYSGVFVRNDDNDEHLILRMNKDWKIAKASISKKDFQLIIRPVDKEGTGTYEIIPFGYNHRIGTLSYEELDKTLNTNPFEEVMTKFYDDYHTAVEKFLETADSEEYVEDDIIGSIEYPGFEKWNHQRNLYFRSFRNAN